MIPFANQTGDAEADAPRVPALRPGMTGRGPARVTKQGRVFIVSGCTEKKAKPRAQSWANDRTQSQLRENRRPEVDQSKNSRASEGAVVSLAESSPRRDG